MPPKKKKGKGGGKKAAKIIDGLSTNEMSPVQLLGHIKRLQAEIDREREERNFFMLEREKLFTLWNLAVEQLSEEKQKARLLDVQMEQNKKETEHEMDLQKQKLRFLQAEQAKKLGLVRLNHLQKMKKIQDDIWAIQLVMKESLAVKKKQLRQSQVSLYEMLRRMHVEHAERVSNMRKQFAAEIRRLEMTMDRKLVADREAAELAAKAEMSKIMQMKEEQLEQMLLMHEKKILEMKTFFNDLTFNNFAVLTSLQADIANKKIEEQRLRRELKESKEKYFEMLGPVKEMEKQLEEWEGEDFDAKAIHQELHKVNQQLDKNKRYTRMIECANEALTQRMGLLKTETTNVKKEFTKEVLDMQRKSSMKKLVMELKLRSVKHEAALLKAMIEAKLKMATSGGDPNEIREAAIQEFLQKQGVPLSKINDEIAEANFKIRTVAEDLQEACENASIPFEEIGYALKVPKGGLRKKSMDLKKPIAAKKVKKNLPRSVSSKSSKSHSSVVSQESMRSRRQQLQQQAGGVPSISQMTTSSKKSIA